ncbi:MAG: tetratricopeptide repeat protein [bacterium]
MSIVEQKLATAFDSHKQGDLRQAKQLYIEVLNFEPSNSEALFFIGVLHVQTQELEIALGYLEEYLKNNIDAEALKQVADISFDLQRFEKAVKYYEAYLNLVGEDFDVLQNYATALVYSGYFVKSAEVFEVVCKEKETALDYFNLGFALSRADNPKKALDCYLKAYELDSTSAATCINLAGLYYDLYELEKALYFNKKAIENNPDCAESYNNSGNSYLDLNMIDEAIESFYSAVKLNPSYDGYKFNLARAYFAKGDLENGWEYFKYRRLLFERKDLKVQHLNDFSGNLEGKTVFVYYEAGYGDVIQYARYIPFLIKAGAKVIFEVQDGLLDICKRSFPDVQVVGQSFDYSDVKYDLQTNLFCLVWFFKEEKFPFADGFLISDSKKVHEFSKKYFNNSSKKIGLVWHSKNNDLRDRLKSVEHLSAFNSLADVSDVMLYSLLVGSGVNQIEEVSFSVESLGSHFTSFDDTAAAIMGLDLLITVDTSVAHLAGSLGVKTWLMLPYAPNWRWFTKGKDSPYYSSMRIFRQKVHGDWTNVFKEIVHELQNLGVH